MASDAWFDRFGAFHLTVGDNKGPFADLESGARENIDFGVLHGAGVGASHSHEISISKRPISIHGSTQMTMGAGYATAAVVDSSWGWVQMYGLAHRANPNAKPLDPLAPTNTSLLDTFGLIKTQFSHPWIGCTQALLTTSNTLGLSILRPVSQRVALGLEWYCSMPQNDRTFCIGVQFTNPTNLARHKQLHHQQQPRNTQTTFTVSSFGQLSATVSHPILLPAPVGGSLYGSLRGTFTIPPPSEMRLGAQPDPPLLSAGFTFTPHSLPLRLRAMTTPQQARVKLEVEGNIRPNVVVGLHLDSKGTSNQPVWGVQGSLRL